MSVATLSPAGTGVGWAAALGAVPDAELLEVLRREYRALSRQQARVYAVMAEVGRRTGDGGRAERAVPSAVQEIGPALVLTESAAFAEHDLAEQLRVELPAVGAALWAGDVDRAKARVFVDHTRDLPADQRSAIVDDLLPGASRWTTGQLADRLRRRVRQVDPAAVGRGHDRAVAGRRVTGYLAQDGTAVVTGSGLVAADAAAALRRVGRLARLVRKGGHPDRVAQIRADVYIGLLDGSFTGMTDAQVVQALLARLDADPPRAVPGVEVRAALTTLAGADEHDGELVGWGPITADAARELVHRQHGGAWRFVVTDEAGRALLTGAVRHRPPGAVRTLPADGDPGVVELQVGVDDLHRSGADPPPGWERILADLLDRWDRRHETWAEWDARPDDRFPSAGLRRYVQVRDRTCTFPGCRCPARRTQVDHTTEFQDGGPTVAANLGLLCAHHHALKSAGGWRSHQYAPGRFDWTSRLGGSYRTGGQPSVLPATDPAPPPF